MAELLEALMVISFGISWPMNIVNPIPARVPREKVFCLCCLFCSVMPAA